MDVVLVIICIGVILLGLSAIRVEEFRVGQKWFNLSLLWTAAAAVIVTWLLFGGFRDELLAKAGGDREWVDDEFTRWLLILLPAITVGYWVWVLMDRWAERRRQRRELNRPDGST